jgi:WD40 repeat protein
MVFRQALSLTGLTLCAVLLGLLGCSRSDETPKQEQPLGLRATLDGHSRVSQVVFGPDSRTLAVGSETDAVRVWDLDKKRELFRLKSAVNSKALAFSPDGRILATACNEPVIRLWDARSGQEKTAYRGTIGNVRLLAFSPDGNTLASWSEPNEGESRVHLWDVASGTQKKPLQVAMGSTEWIGFSPDGKTLVVARNLPGGVDFWDLATRRRKAVTEEAANPPAGEGWIGEVCHGADGQWMVFCKDEAVVRLWELDKHREKSVFEVSHRANLPTASMRGDGKLAAIGEGDGILTLWNPTTGKKVAIVQASGRHVPYAYFSPDGRTMATHEILESAVKIWDVPALTGNDN